MTRVTYLVSHPIQYQVPFFRAVTAAQKVDLTVCFGCRWGVEPTLDPNFGKVVDFGVDLLSGYTHRFLDHPVPETLEFNFRALKARDIDAFLAPTKPEVLVIHGWATMLMWQGMWWAKQRRIPVLLRGENPAFAHYPESQNLKRILARTVLRQTFLRWAAGMLVLGQANRRFYEILGVRSSKLFPLPYFVDNDAVRIAATIGRASRAAKRAKLGVPQDALVAASIGKLMPKKRPQDLPRLLGRLPSRVHGLWIGSGALEAETRAVAAKEGVEARMHFTGFCPPNEAWALLGASDIFFFPAEDEKWGLVLNEAFASGLPALVSDYVGSAEDLVERGLNGDIFPCGDLEKAVALAKCWIGRLPLAAHGPEIATMMRKAEGHSLATASSLFADAVQQVARVPTSRPKQTAIAEELVK